MGAWKKLTYGRRCRQLIMFSREACPLRRSCVRKLNGYHRFGCGEPVRTRGRRSLTMSGAETDKGYPRT